jgi:Ras GTPase-activating-like protein IQGAP2/3
MSDELARSVFIKRRFEFHERDSYRLTERGFFIDLQRLRALTDGFIDSFARSTQDMPFGLRYIAREVYRALRERYPNDPEEDIIRVVGHFVYYRFIQPAIM